MNPTGRPRINPKVILGCIMIAIGGLFALQSFGIIESYSLWEFWPVILIVVGVMHVLRPRNPGQRVWGAIEVVFGILFLLRTLGVFWISFWRIWPILLVVAGAHLIWQAVYGRRILGTGPGSPGERIHDGAMAGLDATGGLREPAEPARVLDEMAVFGGGDRVIRTSDFRGGQVVAIFGAFDIDLREAQMASDSAVIDVFVVFGGLDLRVPEGWNVVVAASAIFGACEYKPRPTSPASPEAPRKTLTITGTVIFGGVDVKNG